MEKGIKMTLTEEARKGALAVLDTLPFYLSKNDPRSGIKDPCDKATITRLQIETIRAALTAQPVQGEDKK